MDANAYVLDWTMDNYDLLKQELSRAGFSYRPEGDTNDIRITIPFERVGEAAAILQSHLNAPYNYVDVQFPDERRTVIIFREKVFTIASQAENDTVVAWALARGLPREQADWGVSF